MLYIRAIQTDSGRQMVCSHGVLNIGNGEPITHELTGYISESRFNILMEQAATSSINFDILESEMTTNIESSKQ